MACSSSLVDSGAWQCGQTMRIMFGSLLSGYCIFLYSNQRSAILYARYIANHQAILPNCQGRPLLQQDARQAAENLGRDREFQAGAGTEAVELGGGYVGGPIHQLRLPFATDTMERLSWKGGFEPP